MASPFIPCLLDLQKFIVAKDCICDWKLFTQLPVEKSTLSEWESQNGWRLPADLRAFYETSDGLSLSYSGQLNSETKQRIGSFSLNPLEQVRQLSISCDPTFEKMSIADADALEDISNWMQPSLTAASRGECGIFELEHLTDCCAIVCLVMRKSRADIWLLDRSLRMHWLAGSFSDYYTLALAHLCLQQWQLCLTDIGPSATAMQWLQLLAPLRLQADAEVMSGSDPDSLQQQHHLWPPEPVELDKDRVFRGKSITNATAGSAGGAATPDRRRAATNAQATAAKVGQSSATKRYATATRTFASKTATARK